MGEGRPLGTFKCRMVSIHTSSYPNYNCIVLLQTSDSHGSQAPSCSQPERRFGRHHLSAGVRQKAPGPSGSSGPRLDAAESCQTRTYPLGNCLGKQEKQPSPHKGIASFPFKTRGNSRIPLISCSLGKI